MAKLPPVPLQSSIQGHRGYLTQVWAEWFQQLFIRVGGHDATTNEALAAELEDHLGDTSGAHAASAISNSPSGNLAATNVQSALNELQTDVDSRALDSDLDAHLADVADAHDASAISYDNATSGLTADDLQEAIDELKTDVDGISGGAVTKAKNYAQNAEFRFWQRQDPATLTSRQDDQYSADRWYVLTSGGAVNVQGARVEESPSGSPSRYCAQFRQADATDRQFGIAQLLEADRVWELRGKQVTLHFWARTDAAEIATLRAGIVEWSGTADSVTSDLVSAWAATPTLVASAAFVNTPADLSLTGTWAEFSITVTLGTSFTNLGLFFWTPNAEAQNDDFYITQVQLVQATSEYDWPVVSLSVSDDLHECLWFYEKTYSLDTAPGSITTNGVCRHRLSGSYSGAQMATQTYMVPKRVVPSTEMYSPATGTAGRCHNNSAGADREGNMQAGQFTITGAHTNGLGTSADLAFIDWHWTADAEL